MDAGTEALRFFPRRAPVLRHSGAEGGGEQKLSPLSWSARVTVFSTCLMEKGIINLCVAQSFPLHCKSARRGREAERGASKWHQERRWCWGEARRRRDMSCPRPSAGAGREGDKNHRWDERFYSHLAALLFPATFVWSFRLNHHIGVDGFLHTSLKNHFCLSVWFPTYQTVGSAIADSCGRRTSWE